MSSERIRALNDAFRTSFASGRVVTTAGVQALGTEVVAQALQATRTFSEFTEANDPHGEHDCGAFDLKGTRFFWKIDCYDKHVKSGSADPADPDATTCVLTIMLADEY